ncbi:MAG: 7-cyano-7-deazaguanine synthase [bacterium]|nr:MAG: 7-cyano-7-deazaguanine synthase [bacterium]
MRMKALCLFSGGLDSTLAARLMLDLGIDVEALHFVTAFCTCTPNRCGGFSRSRARTRQGG